MKINMSYRDKRSLFLLCSVLTVMLFSVLLLHGEMVVVPGDVSRICYYSNYFYNFPTEDFLYYLNDRLLFWERPDDFIVPNGIRDKLINILSWHKKLEKFFLKHAGEKKNSVSFNLVDPDDYDAASELLTLLGHNLRKNDKGQYYLAMIPDSPMAGYLDFSLIRPQVLEQQINRTNTFYFLLKDTELPLPPGLTLEFLREVSGLKIDASSFFEYMLKDERFSLLLGILYRLSNTEIEYIANLIPGQKRDAWRKIYNDKKMLIGLFVLSNAFRVTQAQQDRYQIALPGGAAAQTFWAQMAGENGTPLDTSSFEFLKRLVTKDDGKLNLLYVFSSFLPDNSRKALFFNYDAALVKEIYNRIILKDNEKLNEMAFPEVNDWSYFTLMYGFKVQGEEVYFPQGIDTWIQAIRGETSAAPGPASSTPPLYNLLSLLLEKSGNGNMSDIRKFMAIYTKFSNRPHLLDKGALGILYNNYERYNGLVDFIEKIPIKKPETVLQMFNWLQRLENLGGDDHMLFTVIYQSLFEILSFTAKYGPDLYDYDLLVSELIALPLSRAQFYREIFQFFNKNLNIKSRGLVPVQVMLRGIPNPDVTIGDSHYKFMIKNVFQKTINEILQAQEVCSFSDLLEINRLLDEGLKEKTPANGDIAREIREMFLKLPFPGISDEAPKFIRDRVMPYNQSKMLRVAKGFVDKIHLGADQSQLQEDIAQLDGDYLIFQLRDHLLTLAYAVNAKDSNLKAFLNPNFVRLHDLTGCEGLTLWDNDCKNKIKKPRQLSEYSLSGGLSRLNILFASRWQEHLFRENILLNPAHVQGMITNLLDMYPLPLVDQSLTYKALLVELGLGLLREATENISQALKQDVSEAVQTVTAGYHYRQAMAYINGESNHHNLYFSEICRLGESFLAKYNQREYLEGLPVWKKLKTFLKPPLSDEIKAEIDRFGCIFSHTFGNVEPKDIHIFPQELSNFLTSGWLSGSMIDEFKVKLAYHMYKKQTPPSLLGQFLYMYLDTTGRRFLRQNHFNDYPITYFIFDIFNTSHLNRLITKLQKEGYLKLK